MRLLPRLTCVLATGALGLLTTWLCSRGGEDTIGTIPPHCRSEPLRGPYCGIHGLYHGLYHALHAVGIAVDFDSLAQDAYVGSARGSSAEELKKAATDHGARAAVREGMGVGNLQFADTPMLLHLRQPGQDAVFDHWVLFLGCERDRARIIDNSNEVASVPVGELLALWDGTGVLVSRDGGFNPEIAACADSGLVVLVGFLFILTGVIATNPFKFGVRENQAKCLLFETFALILFSCGVSAAWHWLRPEGFLFNRSAVGLVAEKRLRIDVPVIGLTDFEGLREQDEVLIIDARLTRDYRAGHIPGAVNIPVTADWLDRQALLQRLPARNTRVIVYCQSNDCPWAGIIARAMIARGYSAVVRYSGGYQEWVQNGRVTLAE
jgi:rhodanese-related sulfurtransferase